MAEIYKAYLVKLGTSTASREAILDEVNAHLAPITKDSLVSCVIDWQLGSLTYVVREELD